MVVCCSGASSSSSEAAVRLAALCAAAAGACGAARLVVLVAYEEAEALDSLRAALRGAVSEACGAGDASCDASASARPVEVVVEPGCASCLVAPFCGKAGDCSSVPQLFATASVPTLYII